VEFNKTFNFTIEASHEFTLRNNLSERPIWQACCFVVFEADREPPRWTLIKVNLLHIIDDDTRQKQNLDTFDRDEKATILDAAFDFAKFNLEQGAWIAEAFCLDFLN